MPLRTSCLIALLFAASAHAQAPPDAPAMSAEQAAQMQAAMEGNRAYSRRIAAELAASGGARELALAATLLEIAAWNPPPEGATGGDAPSQPGPRDPRIAQWRRLASARAGRDVIANALLTGADARASDAAAVRDAAIDRWRRLEPDNLWPRLYMDGDIGTALTQARATRRSDAHLYPQVRWIQSALLAHPPTQTEREAMASGGEDFSTEAWAAMHGMGIVLAVATPSLQSLVEACRGDALSSTPTRRDDCRHVAQVMADASDTNLGQSIGIGLLERLAATDAERAEADARRRRLDWQMLAWGRISASQPQGGAAQFARLLHDPAVHSEHDLVERVLEQAGIALDPPAGWESPRRN